MQPIKALPTQRVLYLNRPEQGYADNYVRTSKYNALNFLPLSILYQYKRLANCYNLFIAAISLIPGVAPWAPYTWIAPMVAVLLVAILREGVEDYMRYKQDRRTNSQVVERVVSEGRLEETTSKEIRVGDVIKVSEGQELPADIILVQSSDEGAKRSSEVDQEGPRAMSDRG